MSDIAKILIIEDDANVRELVRDFFEYEFKSELTEAVDGLDGYVQAATNSFDLIVTDLQMPFLDGWSFIRALRTKENLNQHVPVILFSGFLSSLDPNHAPLSDVHFVDKPLDPKVFTKIVSILLAKVA